MRYELKSVGIWSFTKVSFFINLPIGFMFGLMYAVMLPLMIGMSQFGGFPGPAIDTSEFPFGVMLVVLPLLGAMFAAVFHTLFGVVLLAIYNLIVRMIGGLEFELDPVKVARSALPLRPTPIHTGIEEAAVTVPPVSNTPTTSTMPPPPPAVPGVSQTTAPSAAPAPKEPLTEMPVAPPAPSVKPTTTEMPAPPLSPQPKSPDDKTEDDKPPAPETT